MKSAVFTVFLILILFTPLRKAEAQSDEEMAILQMFYKDKDLVESATRHAKPISQVAENITVITAREIENMNAHTVADILNRVPGFFIPFNRDFGATSLLQIQGSEDRHVLVLLDGIPWNSLAGGSAETNSIPVGAIERIEVIKGPGSSAWGSSLGGVVNIITKGVGTTVSPNGSLQASGGERSTQDYRASISGKAGVLGYYLYASRQESDGLRSPRDFDTYNLYSKFDTQIGSKVKTQISVGYSEPNVTLGDFPPADISESGLTRTFFGTASIDFTLSKNLTAKLSFHHFGQKFVLMDEVLGLGFYGLKGETFLDNVYDEETNAGRAKLIWEGRKQTAVLGVDVDYGRLTQRQYAGPFLQSFGYPPVSTTHPDMNRWAVYANDTIVIGRWSVTPGVRYDDNNVTGSFVSPSLGATYQFRKDSIFRASVARGFTVPPLSWISGGTLFIQPNSSLDSEEVWSYQAGLETVAAKYFWLKMTFFRHDLKDVLTYVPGGAGPPEYKDLLVNGGGVKHTGGELETETIQYHNCTLVAGLSYVHLSRPNTAGTRDRYTYSIGLTYEDQHSLRAELFGHYVWWDDDAAWEGKYDDFLWDLNLKKKVYSKGNFFSEIFLTAHNLFNGSQYNTNTNQNPRRWVEGGIRIKF